MGNESNSTVCYSDSDDKLMLVIDHSDSDDEDRNVCLVFCSCLL